MASVGAKLFLQSELKCGGVLPLEFYACGRKHSQWKFPQAVFGFGKLDSVEKILGRFNIVYSFFFFHFPQTSCLLLKEFFNSTLLKYCQVGLKTFGLYSYSK